MKSSWWPDRSRLSRTAVKPSNPPTPPIPISFLAHPSGITQLCRIDIDGFVLRLQKGSRLGNANVKNSKVQDRRDLWCLPIVQVLIAGPMKSIVNVYYSMSFYVIISGFKCYVNSYIYLDLPDLENFQGLRLNPRFVPQNQGFRKKPRFFQKPGFSKNPFPGKVNEMFFSILFSSHKQSIDKLVPKRIRKVLCGHPTVALKFELSTEHANRSNWSSQGIPFFNEKTFFPRYFQCIEGTFEPVKKSRVVMGKSWVCHG